MESRSGRPDRDAEHVGDLVERLVQVVGENHHRPGINGELPEGALQAAASREAPA